MKENIKTLFPEASEITGIDFGFTPSKTILTCVPAGSKPAILHIHKSMEEQMETAKSILCTGNDSCPVCQEEKRRKDMIAKEAEDAAINGNPSPEAAGMTAGEIMAESAMPKKPVRHTPFTRSRYCKGDCTHPESKSCGHCLIFKNAR